MRGPKTGVVLSVWAVMALSPRLAPAATDETYGEFFDRVRRETLVLRKARELESKYAPKKQPSRAERLLEEERIRYQLRRLAPAPAGPVPKEAVPNVDVERAAREFVEVERRRTNELHAARLRRMLALARSQAETGRLELAERMLLAALAEEPRNREAAALLRRVRSEKERLDVRRAARAMERETAEAMRTIDRARVPHAAVLTYPRDWAERSARARARAANAAATEVRKDRAAVDAALRRQVSIDAVEMTIDDVAEYLRGVAGLNIIVEPEALDKTVTVRLKNTDVASLLGWVTRLTGLEYAVDGACIHIGRRDQVRTALVTRVYDVSDILQIEHAMERNRKMRWNPLTGRPMEAEEGWGVAHGDKVRSLDELGESLIDFLQTSTGRKQWGDGPGDARIDLKLGRLVVNAEPDLQQRILEVLQHLRK